MGAERRSASLAWLSIVGGDATTLRLPALPEVVDEFGVHGDRWGGEIPLAQVFGLMDVTSGLLVHADMWASRTREREMLASSLAQVRPDDLLLLDRGFPSHWFVRLVDPAPTAFFVCGFGMVGPAWGSWRRSSSRRPWRQ